MKSTEKKVGSGSSIPYYIFPPLLLITITIFFYYDSLRYAFQFDDLANIVKNFQVRSGTFTDLFLANTRWISQWINSVYYQHAKFEPWIYRCGNLAIHTITGTMVYFVVVLCGQRLKPEHILHKHCFSIAFITAGLFLLHPVQTQTVSYIIQGQLEGLSACVTIAMILSFLLWFTRTRIIAQACCFIALIFFTLLAPGTKEIAIISPVLLLLIDWFFVARGNLKSLRSRWWLHLLVWVLIIGMYIYYLKPQYFITIFGLQSELQNNMGNTLTDRFEEKITPAWYCMSQFKVILHYIAIFFWPFTMSVDYDWKLVDSFFSLDCILPFMVLSATGWYVLYRLYKNKTDVIAFCFLWFFITLLPRSTIIPSTELVADYKTYLASFGLFLLCALGIENFCQGLAARVRGESIFMYWIGLLCLLLPLGYALHERNKVWRSGIEFWGNIIRNAPLKARAHNNYGVSLCEETRYHEAIGHFKKAIALDKIYSDPHNNIAVAYGSLGDIDAAIGALKDSIKIHPMQPEAYNNMASFYLTKKDYSKSEELLRTAIKLRPHYGKAHFNLGRTYADQGKLEDAWRCFKTSCMNGDFDTPHGFFAYGSSSVQLQKYDDAIHAFKCFLKVAPNVEEVKAAYGNIVTSYLAKKDLRNALVYLEKLKILLPDDIGVEFQMGRIRYDLGDYQQALECFTRVQLKNNLFFPVYVCLADTLAALGKKPEARALLRDVIASRPQQEVLDMTKAKLKELDTK